VVIGMNQYIITEEQLQSIEQDNFVRRKLFRAIRSRPYQNQREKVLDSVIGWCQKGIDALKERQQDGMYIHGDIEKIELLYYEIKFLEQLRGEQ
jgi:hypothetical protein